MTRTSLQLVVVLVLSMAAVGVVHAQADDTSPPTGPQLQVAPATPMICDAGGGRMRYVEIRGSGFDAWAGQRLVGTLIDASGAARAQWPTVWVTRTGRLTVEVNVCADAFRNRPALPSGDYSISVESSAGAPVAATGFSLQAPAPPPDAIAPAEDTNPPD
jgi:hypothetical protein